MRGPGTVADRTQTGVSQTHRHRHKKYKRFNLNGVTSMVRWSAFHKSARRLMAILLALYRENKGFVLVGTVLVMLSALANVLTLNFINETIASQGEFLIEHTLLVLAILICAFISGAGAQMMMTQLGFRVIRQMRGRLLRQVLNTDYESMIRQGNEKVYAAITKDVASLQAGFTLISYVLYSLTLLVAGIAYMFWLQPLLAAIVVGLLVLTTVVTHQLLFRFHRNLREERDLEDDLFEGYNQILSGHKELLLNEARGDSIWRKVMDGPALKAMWLRTHADRYLVTNIHMMTTVVLLQIMLIFWLVYRFELGSLALASSFALTLMFIRQPINMFLNNVGQVLIARVALKKLQSLDLAEVARPDLTPALEWNRLELDRVVYRYPADRSGFQLGPISLNLEQGELVFLVGHNGAGKTTLLRLILGLLEPSEGIIRIDGKPLSADQIRSYRHGYSAVLADFHLFSEAQLSDTDEATIQHWLNRLQLSSKVKLEDGVFSTVSLSTGQRKRLAMVSAIAEGRKVMVLDEWAADQDPVFRELFYRELLPELKAAGYTLLVVSHDDRYFDVADRLISMDHGHLENSESKPLPA